MSEWSEILLAAIKLITVGVFAVLYAVGGRHKTWIRRYAGGLFIAGSTIGFSVYQGRFHTLSLVALATIPAALASGYGAETFWGKVTKRLRYGVLMALASLPIALAGHSVGLWSLQALLCVIASIGLGVFNPVKAVEEEVLIATLSVLLVPFLI